MTAYSTNQANRANQFEPHQEEVIDRYEREEILAAPRGRVWAAITEPGQLRLWFATPTYPLEPGGRGELRFRSDDGSETGEGVEVVAVEPPYRFAFRWRPYPVEPGVPVAPQPSTLVELTLTDAPGGTRLRIVESGFAGLPEDVRAAALRDNTAGWTEAVRNLAGYLTRS